GNGCVHLRQRRSYPVAGMLKAFRPPCYAVNRPLLPHGMSIILHTPAVVRFTAYASPERHPRAAAALGSDLSDVGPADAGELLAQRVISFMRLLGMPNGLAAVGYSEADIPALAHGTLPQHRVRTLARSLASEADLGVAF